MAAAYSSPREVAITPVQAQSPKLLDRLRGALRTKHYAYRTEQAYVGWVRRFIFFHGKRHPQEMGGGEIELFLTTLAVHGRVAASTQTQALCALLFLYKHVLGVALPPLAAARAKRPKNACPPAKSDLDICILSVIMAPTLNRSDCSLTICEITVSGWRSEVSRKRDCWYSRSVPALPVRAGGSLAAIDFEPEGTRASVTSSEKQALFCKAPCHLRKNKGLFFGRPCHLRKNKMFLVQSMKHSRVAGDKMKPCDIRRIPRTMTFMRANLAKGHTENLSPLSPFEDCALSRFEISHLEPSKFQEGS